MNFLKKIFSSLILTFLFFSIKIYAQDEMTVAQKRVALVEECKTYIGTPYVYGGETKQGIDCSGLIMITVKNITGISLPRRAKDIYAYVRIIPDDKKQIGDLLFFKTNGAEVSHVAVYIGKNQFIHAISDGPNTGVIVSSLNQDYWRTRYVGVGSIFKSSEDTTGFISTSPGETQTKTPSSDKERVFYATVNPATLKAQNEKCIPVDFGLTAFFNWNFFSSDAVFFNPRGFSIQLHVRYNRWKVKPGICVDFRGEPKMNAFQIPLFVTISPLEYISVYLGAVFTIGLPTLIGTESALQPLVFPGIIGVSFQTPAIQIKNSVGIRLVQDISYVVYTNKAGGSFSFADAMSAGLCFQTGIRFDIYIPKITKKDKSNEK